MALEADLNGSCAGGPGSLMRLSVTYDRSRGVGGEVPLKLSLHYHASCVLNLFCGGLLPGKEERRKEREKEKRERETTTN